LEQIGLMPSSRSPNYGGPSTSCARDYREICYSSAIQWIVQAEVTKMREKRFLECPVSLHTKEIKYKKREDTGCQG